MKHLISTLILSLTGLFATAQTIEYTYHFNQPVVNNVMGYQQIQFQGCRQNALAGQPTLPWQQVSLLLPLNHDADWIKVEFSDFIELEGTYALLPQQEARTISSNKPFRFIKDEHAYRSELTYPEKTHGEVSTHYLNGTSFAFSGFTPVRYIPATGKVSYAQTVKVSIGIQPSREDHSCKLWLTPNNKDLITRLAQNRDMISAYEGRGREVSGYDILVVTPHAWIEKFDAYVDFHLHRGYRVHIAALEDICASMDGRDVQEQIRNYVIQEYEENGISMLLLGGDVALTPFRYLYCYVSEETQDQLPADMYFSCLDGTMNDDDDEYWGEVDEVDLEPEIGVARLPFNDEAQFDILMHKIFTYADSPVLGEFRMPILGGEHLGDGYYGGVGLDRLIGTSSYNGYTTIGYPEDYDVVRVYASETHEWSGDELRDAMGRGGQYVYHDGHAGTEYVAGWFNSTVTEAYFANNNGVDHNYLPWHTHGCDCGNYPEDCIVERLITNPTGCVVSAGNSRFGWYIPFGDGPSDHLCRELVDSYCHDSIAEFSLAYRESKVMTAPWIETGWGGGEYAALRWNYYDLNTFGDAALSIWFDEPFYPEVRYTSGLAAGSNQTQVAIYNKVGTPFANCRVSLYEGESLLAFATSNRDGIANLQYESMDAGKDLQLIVTGQNAWPQTFPVRSYDNSMAYVELTDFQFNGIAEFNQTLTLNLTLQNIGNIATGNTTATLSCDSPFANIASSELEIGTLSPSEARDYENVFTIRISDDIPDLTHLIFTLEVTDGHDTWSKALPLDVMAPSFRFVDLEMDDCDGNCDGCIDVGEPITIHLTGRNTGHALAPETFLRAICQPAQVIIPEETIMAGDINPNETFTIDLSFTTDENTIQGTIFDIHLFLKSGKYQSHETYTFSAGRPTEDFETGDFSKMEWTFDGELPWVVTTENPHSGTYCARSGAVDHNQYSRMIISTDLLEEGTMSFYYKLSSKSLRDYFRFYVDGTLKLSLSGEQDWEPADFHLEAGEHTLTWSFERQLDGEAGSNCTWVDDIIFPAKAIILDVEAFQGDMDEAIVYPNPTKDNITIMAEDLEKLIITNALGQNVYTLESIGSPTVQINMAQFGAGIYFIRIQTAKVINTKKIIVRQ